MRNEQVEVEPKYKKLNLVFSSEKSYSEKESI